MSGGGFPLHVALRYLRSARRDAFTSFLSAVAAGGLGAQETPAALIEQLQQGTHKPRPPSFPQRTLGIGAQILRDVGVRKMRLLSFPVNYKAVSGFELEVVEFVSFDQEQA